MTKKKDGNTKRSNQTDHRTAMKNPKVQAVLNSLQLKWNTLSSEQLGGHLITLIELKCSRRGIAKYLNKPDTTIRRYIDLVNDSKHESDSIAEMGRTLAKRPEEESSKSPLEAARESKAMFQASKSARLEVNKHDQAKKPQHALKTQLTGRTPSPVPAVAEEPRVGSEGRNEKENRTQEAISELTPLQIYNRTRSSMSDRIPRLASIAESIPSRPYRDARSMKPQGKPVPPADPD